MEVADPSVPPVRGNRPGSGTVFGYLPGRPTVLLRGQRHAQKRSDSIGSMRRTRCEGSGGTYPQDRQGPPARGCACTPAKAFPTEVHALSQPLPHLTIQNICAILNVSYGLAVERRIALAGKDRSPRYCFSEKNFHRDIGMQAPGIYQEAKQNTSSAHLPRTPARAIIAA